MMGFQILAIRDYFFRARIISTAPPNKVSALLAEAPSISGADAQFTPVKQFCATSKPAIPASNSIVPASIRADTIRADTKKVIRLLASGTGTLRHNAALGDLDRCDPDFEAQHRFITINYHYYHHYWIPVPTQNIRHDVERSVRPRVQLGAKIYF